MQEIEFKIFTKKKGPQLTVNKVVYSFLVVSFGMIYLGDKFFGENLIKSLGQGGLILALILILYFKIAQIFNREPLNGTLNEILKFTERGIEIDSKKYLLTEVKKIEFKVCDYFNNLMQTYKGDLNPGRTNGTSNICAITLINDRKIKLSFQLMYEKEFLTMRELLIKYYFENKIQFLKLIEYLEIGNYNDVQEFKKNLFDLKNGIKSDS